MVPRDQKMEITMEDTVAPQTGITAFFDILGYKGILENNEPEDIAKTVLRILKKLPNDLQVMQTAKLLGNGNGAFTKELVDAQRWLVFSDSILLTVSYSQKPLLEEKRCQWAFALYASVLLYKYMFDNGLPVRGCLSFGRYVVDGTLFAGRPIVDAYEASNRFDLSVIAVDARARTELETVGRNETFFCKLLSWYEIPCKDNKTELWIVLPPCPPECRFESHNFGGYVKSQFGKHRKTVSPSVQRKVDNSVAYLNCMKILYPISVDTVGGTK